MKASETLRAPAKLNLTLEVLSRRPDGLHGLRSVMVPIDLADTIRITRQSEFSFVCSDAALQEQNLAVRAFDALGLQDRGYRIELHKRIPAGAGMGGGSSDAAAILLAAQRGIFGTPPPLEYLPVARALGSDVPFFLVETAALVEATGERVTALGAVPGWHAVIVKPPIAISTADAYARIDASPRSSRPRNESASVEMAEALQRADFEAAQALLQNDFHDVLADEPPIRAAIQMLREAGAAHPMLTGSGSCVFALCPQAQNAAELAARLPARDGYAVFTAGFWNGEAWRTAA